MIRFFKITFVTIFIVSIIYTGAWFSMARYINKNIMQFYVDHGTTYDFNFYDGMPQVQGFPFTPYISYNYGFETPNYVVIFDKLKMSGFAIPSFPIKIEFFNDLRIISKRNSKDLHLKSATLNFKAPKFLPRTSYEYDIRNWQEKVGQLEITKAEISYDDFLMTAHGLWGLDEELQFTANLETKIYKYDSIIDFLVYTDALSPIKGIGLLSAMNAISQFDNEKQQDFIETNLRIEDRKVSLGPINLKNKIGEMKWK